MMVLDIPGSPRWAGIHRKTIRKYTRFLTRLTGKALWLLYLGQSHMIKILRQNNDNNTLMILHVTTLVVSTQKTKKYIYWKDIIILVESLMTYLSCLFSL